MMHCTSHYVECLGRQLHFTEWGHGHAQTVIAWHGLARTGRDFDELAARLSEHFRVICPDTLGRGLSEWSTEPQDEYHLAFYVQQAVALMDTVGVARAHWVGTSMGGAIAIHGLGHGPQWLKNRISRLVLNDMAPELADAAVERIKAYAGHPPQFARITELEGFLRQVYAPFGPLTDAQWQRMAETSWRRLENGAITTHYDPAMVGQFIHHSNDYDQWDAWETIDIPVLCLHGQLSDLILPTTITQMRHSGPGRLGLLEVIEVDGVGHAPALNTDQQIGWIHRFLKD